MTRKFEAEDGETEDCFLVDGVWLPGKEFDKHVGKRLDRIYFVGDVFEFVGTFAIVLFIIWLIKG